MKKVMKAVAALMLMTAVVCTAGCKKTDAPNNGGNDNGGNGGNNGTGLNGHEYVDLGLPSGTLWATCNVGATTPEGYGDYFAWGETEPKTTYNCRTYKWCTGDCDKFTKYCNNSDFGNNGFTDNLTVLQPGDDAATANWGSGWRTPTREQWQELLDNTTSTWTACNGVKGRLFTASNGWIFLPAAGWRGDDVLGNVGYVGYYWSSSLLTFPSGAWDLDFNSDRTHVWDFYCRITGFSVRPVRGN